MNAFAEFIAPPDADHTRPPAVLQVVPRLVTGGVERGTVEVAAALVQAGWKAVVASSGGLMVHDIERAGATHITLPLASKNPLVMRRNIRHLRAVIEQHEIDIVHARSRAPAWSAFYAARDAKRHFVTTFHNVYGSETKLKRRYNAVMARGERVIAISEFVARHAAAQYGVGPDRLRMIHRGVDVSRFDPEAVNPERLISLARAWRLDDSRPVIMLPGRLTRWKGHFDLVEAVTLLGRRDVQCLLVGGDMDRPDYRNELAARIEERGLGGVFHMVGDCRDMPAAYMLADVVISASSEPEGFGRVSVEAQAMGRPVVATDHGGSRETVLPGSTGWLVPPRDHMALAEAIASALSLGVAARIALADRARAHVLAHFQSRAMCDATIGVYEEILFPDLVRTEARSDEGAEAVA
ncbi:MAG TPA: glycosyltransferase family 4 protein [Stellaceae bacterium]|nr:glycosyltransferase family 4 protein [Stellaceae bacterium]